MYSDSLNPFEKRTAMSLALVFSLRMLGLFMIMPVFAIYGQHLTGYSPLWVGFAIGAYGLTQALLQIPAGWLSDKWGRRPVIYAGLLLFALGSLVAAFSDHYKDAHELKTFSLHLAILPTLDQKAWENSIAFDPLRYHSYLAPQ